MQTFRDNANKPIIAFDFDGTLTCDNKFPKISTLRPYASDVTNILHRMGVIVLIWTCRDAMEDIMTGKRHDDITPIALFLRDNNVFYNAINTCIDYAPFQYESRKIYAHMYVDDKGFGWHESDNILIRVLNSFMVNVLQMPNSVANNECYKLEHGMEVDIDALKDYVHRWRMQQSRR